jgi:hypothetical protein
MTNGAITAGSTLPTDAKVCCRNIAARAVNRGGNAALPLIVPRELAFGG